MAALAQLLLDTRVGGARLGKAPDLKQLLNGKALPKPAAPAAEAGQRSCNTLASGHSLHDFLKIHLDLANVAVDGSQPCANCSRKLGKRTIRTSRPATHNYSIELGGLASAHPCNHCFRETFGNGRRETGLTSCRHLSPTPQTGARHSDTGWQGSLLSGAGNPQPAQHSHKPRPTTQSWRVNE